MLVIVGNSLTWTVSAEAHKEEHHGSPHHGTPPEFYTHEIVHKAYEGANVSAKIPVFFSKSAEQHTNMSFFVVRTGKHHHRIRHELKRLSPFTVEVVFELYEVSQGDFGSYEVFMVNSRVRHICFFILKDKGEGYSAALVVGCLIGVIAAVAFVIGLACYLQQRGFPFRRMSQAEDERGLHLNEENDSANDDVFLPDVAHTSGQSRMVPMTTIVTTANHGNSQQE